MSLTVKQAALMNVIIAGNGNDDAGVFQPADLNEILARLDYKTSKESIQFSIRALIKRGFIEKIGMEKRRLRRRVCIAPTQLGRDMAVVAASITERAKFTETPSAVVSSPISLPTIESENIAAVEFEEIELFQS